MNPSIDALIRSHGMLHEGDFALVAVSGGVDSMVLLHYLNEHKNRFQIRLAVVHAHHHLRGNDADADAALVASFCETNNILFRHVNLDVTGERKLRKGSVQVIARDLRYEAFRHVMEDIGANRLAVAHHGDDQVETVLIELLRTAGTGPAGMRAVRPFFEGTLIRPLLNLEKKELYAYARQYQVPFREDVSNQQETYTRNRIRHKLLPVMKEEQPAIHRQIQAFTEDRQLEEDYLQERVRDHLNEPAFNLLRSAGRITFSREAFKNLPSALQKRAVHLLLTYLSAEMAGNVNWNSRNLAQATVIIKGNKPNAKACFDGDVELVCTYDLVVLERASSLEKTLKTQTLPDEGSIMLPSGMLMIQSAKKPERLANSSLSAVTIPLDRCPLTLRSRRPGDRISLYNRQGHQKLKDLMINRKIPLHMRELWPIIVDRHDTILWVPELAVSGELADQDQWQDRKILRFIPDGVTDEWHD